MIADPRLNHVQCLGSRGLHRMAYWEWGDAANPRVLVCVHGLGRQGRDFDALARELSGLYRVVCPDVAGRGQSEALADPSGYQIASYVADMVTLFARVEAKVMHWVGTSMGGVIGMVLASMAGSPIERLVLNDVGPTIQFDSLRRIASYLGQPLRWRTVEEATDYLRTISLGFGPHSREEWTALSRPMLRPDGDGFVLHYDPKIALPFKAITPELAAAGEAQLWTAFDAIRCPTLVLRGADSDVLSSETAKAMTQRGPKARLHEFAGIGHAPTLVAPDQRAVVREFLVRP